MVEALRKNERVFVTIESTIADGLAVPMVGVNTFHTVKGIIDKMVRILLLLDELFTRPRRPSETSNQTLRGLKTGKSIHHNITPSQKR